MRLSIARANGTAIRKVVPSRTLLQRGPLPICRFAIPLSIDAAAAYNIAAGRFLLVNGLTRPGLQRTYCTSFCSARYQPRVLIHPGQLISPASARRSAPSRLSIRVPERRRDVDATWHWEELKKQIGKERDKASVNLRPN
jgi:hypothetical protein